ncbi:hypothetical protein SUGI_0299690 [Cryptomeria japonica]|nr:hypothetical protein SUGI_0299690 [Cryptomeria japonica]
MEHQSYDIIGERAPTALKPSRTWTPCKSSRPPGEGLPVGCLICTRRSSSLIRIYQRSVRPTILSAPDVYQAAHSEGNCNSTTRGTG